MRIASFNLENLEDTAGGVRPLHDRIPVLRDQLDRLRADVLCLQEINAQKPDGEPRATRELRALDILLRGTAYADYARVTSMHRDRHGPLDTQNLVVLSQAPIIASRQYWHDLVTPPTYMRATGTSSPAEPVGWDRPVLHVEVDIGANRRLHVLNVHLRAPLAAFIPGEKRDAFVWNSVAGWAEGFYLAAIKRAGQALEVRLAVDRIFDAEPDALILVCGDMNAEAQEMPLRILRGEEEETGNGALARRCLIPLERSLSRSQRFSVLHAGKPLMLDHALASRPLLRRFLSIEIHNEALTDEVVGYALVPQSPESFHAPIVATFDFDGV